MKVALIITSSIGIGQTVRNDLDQQCLIDYNCMSRVIYDTHDGIQLLTIVMCMLCRV